MRSIGLHRIRHDNLGDGIENGVWVTDGINVTEVPETRYREGGYTPPVEKLAWGGGIRPRRP